MRTRAVEARLGHALAASVRGAGVAASIAAHTASPWISATFEGARHDVTLAAPRSPLLGRWVAALAEAELPMRGHLVASLAVDRIEDDGAIVTLTLTVLTIEDR